LLVSIAIDGFDLQYFGTFELSNLPFLLSRLFRLRLGVRLPGVVWLGTGRSRRFERVERVEKPGNNNDVPT
jgi:hypothetical protein